ncbi:macrophage-expressed gene 1 protein-like [Pteropus vampyrus]|uniref:Macrophage-expressed gene 1 protein-like n=1 Tax=Pteropus vampyrus TaxID=132908 RepID=A0A6P3RME2_PTEVA|nr:macrophage-expressed gene 1 protein-like [Pteropus vampyrus]
MDKWLSYTDTWAASINAEVFYLPMLNGKFSSDFQNVKKHDLEHETVTTRVQVRHNIYSVKAPEIPNLHPAFRQHLVTISDHLENNETREADYLAEMLVLRFGTHVLTHVDVGASLVQEDQVKRDLMSDKAMEKTSISLAASAVFFKLRGSPFYPGIMLQSWQDSIGKRLVAIGRSGLPLPTLIKPEALRELPEPAVHRVPGAVHAAISRYYAVNVHPGCLRRWSPDFNPQANVDDGSCDAGGRTNFSFGGVFQECEAVSGEDAENLCQNYHVANPLTGSTSCPANYTSSTLHRELKTSTQAHPECKRQCRSCNLFSECCDDVCTTHVVKSVMRAWSPPGLYSSGKPNPLTKTQACPTYFFPLTLFGDLKVCVSSDLEVGGSQAVPFGGFFSCQVGNPLAGLKTGQSPGLLQEVFYQNSHTAYPMKCPAAYSQHQAYLSNGCQIIYCLKTGALLDQQQTVIRMPPFLPPPASFNSSRSAHRLSVLKTGISYESLQANNFRQIDPRPSAATIAGIYVGSVVAAVAVALGLTYGFRYYKKGGFRIRQKGILAEEQNTYKATETPAEPGFA